MMFETSTTNKRGKILKRDLDPIAQVRLGTSLLFTHHPKPIFYIYFSIMIVGRFSLLSLLLQEVSLVERQGIHLYLHRWILCSVNLFLNIDRVIFLITCFLQIHSNIHWVNTKFRNKYSPIFLKKCCALISYCHCSIL